jgi:drug/metabolite transporter (DMT)-like permease
MRGRPCSSSAARFAPAGVCFFAVLGELAALGTATCWSVTSLVFAEAARRVGALRVNLLRLPVALVLLSAVLVASRHPFEAVTGGRVGLLAASGVVGLVVGDLAFFASLRRLGARLTSLLMALAPIFAALAALALLREVPGTQALVGIALTLSGVAWVVGEPRTAENRDERSAAGVALGVTGAACQGVGLVLAKAGMAGEVAPLTATWVRIGIATTVIWALTAANRRFTGMGPRTAVAGAGPYILAGAFFGPFLGVWLSLTAAKLTDVGVAATIMATSPILVIPLVMLTERYRPTLRAVIGTVVAVVGVALLFARG